MLTKLRESVAAAKDDPAFTTFLKDNFVSGWEVEPDRSRPKWRPPSSSTPTSPNASVELSAD